MNKRIRQPPTGATARKEDVAAHFGVGVRTVEGWMADRKIPFFKMRHVVRFDLEEVKAALRQQQAAK